MEYPAPVLPGFEHHVGLQGGQHRQGVTGRAGGSQIAAEGAGGTDLG